jgi:hypothetical protein
MPQAIDVELPNSCAVVEANLDEIPSTLDVDFRMPHSPLIEVSPFHVIFYLNKIFIATCFDKRSCTIIFHLRLKEFLEKCFVQFQVYIWFVAQCHNIYNYLDQIWHKTKIFIHASKVFD